jgi:DNA modification methylase
MQTTHQIYFKNANDMPMLPAASIELVVTSPPYPMIEMWDGLFAGQNPSIGDALKNKQGLQAFELMHNALDEIWNEVYRILTPGGFACINIGDAARTIDGNFMLYPNHSRILSGLWRIGFTALPVILWRKQTNAPNKFMGSGMLPSGAYVTLEHEYILILRKGPKREFKSSDTKRIRRESAIFWEERNIWYSDVWLDLKGTTQKLDNTGSRLRSAAFPFEVPYRLINMYSVKGDTVLDPFLGTGTTMWAAMTAARNSIGYEIDQGFKNDIRSKAGNIVALSDEIIDHRIDNHLEFVHKRSETKGELKYKNKHYHFPVVTKQEIELLLNPAVKVDLDKNEEKFIIDYASEPHIVFGEKINRSITNRQKNRKAKRPHRQTQLKLLKPDQSKIN